MRRRRLHEIHCDRCVTQRYYGERRRTRTDDDYSNHCKRCERSELWCARHDADSHDCDNQIANATAEAALCTVLNMLDRLRVGGKRPLQMHVVERVTRSFVTISAKTIYALLVCDTQLSHESVLRCARHLDIFGRLRSRKILQHRRAKDRAMFAHGVELILSALIARTSQAVYPYGAHTVAHIRRTITKNSHERRSSQFRYLFVRSKRSMRATQQRVASHRRSDAMIRSIYCRCAFPGH
jgi:hypothetical protein